MHKLASVTYLFVITEPLNVGSKTSPVTDSKHTSTASRIIVQKDIEADLIEAWDYCKKWSKSVELFYYNENKEKILTKIHFKTYPAVSNTLLCVYYVYSTQDKLPKEVTEKVKYNVNRESPEDKLRDFLTWMKSAKKEINHLVECSNVITYTTHIELCYRMSFVIIGTLTFSYPTCKLPNLLLYYPNCV